MDDGTDRPQLGGVPGPRPPRARLSSAAPRPEKIAMLVARMIAADIVDRDLLQGAALATEPEMARRLGVGRPSVREALRLLEAQGLIIIRPGQHGGPLVRQPSASDLGRTMSFYLQMWHASFGDLVEAAVRLGGVAAAMAAEEVAAGRAALTPDFVETIEAIDLDATSEVEFVTSASRFHIKMYDVAGNATLKLTAGALRFMFDCRLSDAHGREWSPDERVLVRDEHRAIASAIIGGRANEARSLNEAHLHRELGFIGRDGGHLLDTTMDWI